MAGEKRPIVVIGGANVDIRGRNKGNTEWKSSNPANIETGSGGVGRNIAENLARLGIGTIFVSAVGNDFSGRQLLEETARVGVDISRVRKLYGLNTGTYLAFLDKSGDMVLGMSDMEILETIDGDYIAEQVDIFEKAGMVIVDTNLSPKALEKVKEMQERFNFPLVLETVSVAKAPRALPLFPGITVLATNKEELRAIIPCSLNNPQDLVRAGQEILNRGPKILLLKMGSEGFFVFSASGGLTIPSDVEDIVDATGAGDSLVAAFSAGLKMGLGIKKSSILASKVASLTLKAAGSVSWEIKPELLGSD